MTIPTHDVAYLDIHGSGIYLECHCGWFTSTNERGKAEANHRVHQLQQWKKRLTNG